MCAWKGSGVKHVEEKAAVVCMEGERCEAHYKGQRERSARLCREEAVVCAD